MTAKVQVTNIGKYAGKEVVELLQGHRKASLRNRL